VIIVVVLVVVFVVVASAASTAVTTSIAAIAAIVSDAVERSVLVVLAEFAFLRWDLLGRKIDEAASGGRWLRRRRLVLVFLFLFGVAALEVEFPSREGGFGRHDEDVVRWWVEDNVMWHNGRIWMCVLSL